MGDFERIREVAAVATGKVGDELTFPFPEVLSVVAICTRAEIAVLGIDLFEVRSDGYSTKKLSLYSHDQPTQKRLDLTLRTSGWYAYVKASNTLAEEFIRENPSGDDHVYILTTASRKEFDDIQAMKRS